MYSPQFTYPSSSHPCTFTPVLHTPRLTLTVCDPTLQSDIDFCLALFNDPIITAKAGSPGINTPEILDAFLISTSLIPKYTPWKQPLSGPAVYVARTRHGNYSPSSSATIPIGLINVCNRGDNFPPDIGWVIFPQYQQQGYAAEAAQRVFNYFMDEFQGGFRNARPPIGITAVLNLENKASAGVARKIGLVDFGEVMQEGSEESRFPVYGTPNLMMVNGEKLFSRERNRFNMFGEGEAGKRTMELIFGKKEVPKAAEEVMEAVVEVT